MQDSDVPSKFPIPFASSAGGSYTRAIPEASQIGISDGAASLTDGFPPDCFVVPAAGGTPPFGQDFNGLLNQSTSWDRWLSAGGPVKYDATFQTSIGGYPRGAVVQSAVTVGLFWFSTTNANVTNPDSGGAGWTGFSPVSTHGSFFDVTPGAGKTWVVPANVFSISFEAWGGGGGGAGSTPSSSIASGTGSGGGWGRKTVAVTPGQTITYTIAAAGLAGSSLNGNGGDGGATTVTVGATTYSAFGGLGGVAGSSGVTTPGSAAANMDASIVGGASYAMLILNSSIIQASGGAAPRGGQGGPSGVAQPGRAPGGGGGAGGSPSTLQAGGAGGAGGLLIEW